MNRGAGVRSPLIRIVLGSVAALALFFAFLEAMDEVKGPDLPDFGDIAVASIGVGAGLAAASRGWTILFGNRRILRSLVPGFFASQVAKYVPGGFWQPASQLALATRAGVTIGEASAGLAVHMLIQVVAGSTMALGLFFFPDLPPLVYLASAGAVLSLLLLRRKWMSIALRKSERLLRGKVTEDALPSQRSILGSFAWNLGTLLASGAAYGILAFGVDSRFWVRAMIAFGLAWVVGFLAVPFPSGIGVREVILIVLLGGLATPATLIAASALHRLLTIAGEATAALTSSFLLGRKTSDPGTALGQSEAGSTS